MKNSLSVRTITTALVSILLVVVMIPATLGESQEYTPQEEPTLVPRGEHVRQIINHEAVVVVGYRNANLSVDGEWMLLEVGMTVFPGHSQNIPRGAFVLETPDGTEIPLATQAEAQAETRALKALNMRADIQSEPFNYLPVRVQLGCQIGFFANTGKPAQGLPFDEFGVNPGSACIGRIFFNVPNGIEYGSYVLHVTLAESVVHIPIDIMTKEDSKQAKKEYREFEKEQKRLAKEEKKQATESL